MEILRDPFQEIWKADLMCESTGVCVWRGGGIHKNRSDAEWIALLYKLGEENMCNLILIGRS